MTDQPAVRISMEADARELRDVIMSGLFRYNDGIAGPMLNSTVIVAARDAGNAIVGGLIVNFQPGWKWMHLQWLWIDEAHRGAGIGSRMVEIAEQEGRKRGCPFVAVDTFQARDFYERLGYSVYGVMEGYPPGFRRFHMRKTLGDAA